MTTPVSLIELVEECNILDEFHDNSLALYNTLKKYNIFRKGNINRDIYTIEKDRITLGSIS